MIPVTKPFLPPLKELIPYLEELWTTRALTNNGKFHRQLEEELALFLGVPFITLFNNGTTALMCAMKSLDIKGEVITTPYTFAATANAIIWSGLRPIFVDVDERYGNITADNIEKAITGETSAIVALHAYGNPCEVDKINQLAKRNGLKVIYDACHSFGVQDEGGSILRHGDLSVLSFHATKVFNTFEGGAVVSASKSQKNKLDLSKNFGFVNEESIECIGINGKMNEFSAALGLLQLKYVNSAINKRQEIYSVYEKELQNFPGIEFLPFNKKTKQNYSYAPIRITGYKKRNRDDIYSLLKSEGIGVRKYFYPLVCHYEPFQIYWESSAGLLKNAERLSSEILCLPIYPDMTSDDIELVISTLKKSLI